MLERLPGESEFQHHRRIIEGKLVDKTLADYDYSELAPYVYGQEYSADFARRMMYGSEKTLQLLDAERAEESAQDTEDDKNGGAVAAIQQKTIEYQKARQKLFDERVAYNKLVREQARDEELKEILERTIEAGNLPELRYEETEKQESDNDLIVSLNDIHYGAQHDNYWSKYNSDICAAMFGKYLSSIIAIAKTHRSQDCYVTCNGDEVSGVIHQSIRLTNKENVIEQITGVSELIAQFLERLSSHFSNVYFSSVAGNHSRIDKKDDAVLQERLDDLVEWYLKARMAQFENVHIGYGEKIDHTMHLMNVRGLSYLSVHGDFEPSINNITNLQAMVGRPIYAVLMGHRHHNSTDVVQGIRIVQSGSFLGTDNYCITKRLYGRPEQIVCVVEEEGIKCTYDVDLSVM